MRRQWLRSLAAAVAAPVFALTIPSAPAQADPGVLVYPGMEIHQGSTVCTLGFVDPVARTAFTAGHCRGNGPVVDRDSKPIGTLTMFRDNTPDGATVATDHMISDWEAISIAPDVGRQRHPARRAHPRTPIPASCRRPALAVCHFGVITGESCGNIEAVNNGWFTMANGIVSQKGDSGGPVYVVAPDGRAAIVGMFNSTWGNYPAAVSWQTASQQAREDVVSSASGTTGLSRSIKDLTYISLGF